MPKSVCGKWKHDFSYKGKRKSRDLKCNKCGVTLLEWADERTREFEHKHYGTPLNPECGKWDHDFPHGECEDDYKIKCKKCDKSLGEWCDERVKENWNVW